MKRRHLTNCAVLATTLVLGACAGTTPGTTTEEGLVLQDSRVFDELYLRPGMSLNDYAGYRLEDCSVTFRENWMRDQNQQRPDISTRVTSETIEDITQSIGAQCNKYLSDALTEEPMLRLVETDAVTDNLLTIRPSVVDLDIHAPDVDGPGIVRSYTTSFGEMTLVLELVDATTGEVVARAVDKRRGPERGYLQRTNSVTNTFETNRVLRSWSRLVRTSLDNGLENS
jgi:hypothetical protein